MISVYKVLSSRLAPKGEKKTRWDWRVVREVKEVESSQWTNEGKSEKIKGWAVEATPRAFIPRSLPFCRLCR